MLHPTPTVGWLGSRYFSVILVEYVGHLGSVYPIAVFFPSPNQFSGEVLSSKNKEPRKERGAPLL